MDAFEGGDGGRPGGGGGVGGGVGFGEGRLGLALRGDALDGVGDDVRGEENEVAGGVNG